MRLTPANSRNSSDSRPVVLLASQGWWLLGTLLVLGGVGCGPEMTAAEWEALETQAQAEQATNGILSNGILSNGILSNGILSNGLTDSEMSGASFKDWFNSSVEHNASLMSYLVKCAVPAGKQRKFNNPVTGVSYTWEGHLGLALGWSNGMLVSTAEKQVVSACMAALTNKFGVHVSVSLLGQSSSGVPISYTSSELATYSEPEGCFFGNGFDGVTQLYAGSDRASGLSADQSSSRACAMRWASGASADCSPMVNIGSCSQYCTKDVTGTYYTSCTYNGVTYKPITTRIQPADIFRCGDGVCQMSEQCGTGNTYDSCAADCGAC